jgi:hypothetical protein
LPQASTTVLTPPLSSAAGLEPLLPVSLHPPNAPMREQEVAGQDW